MSDIGIIRRVLANLLRWWAARLDQTPAVAATDDGWDIYLPNGMKLAHISGGSW